MTSLSLGATTSSTLEPRSEAASTEARLPFLLGISLFIIVAYTMPFDRSWKVSTFEHYAEAAVDMEGGANEGVFGRQMVLLTFGLFGIVAAAWPGGRTLKAQG